MFMPFNFIDFSTVATRRGSIVIASVLICLVVFRCWVHLSCHNVGAEVEDVTKNKDERQECPAVMSVVYYTLVKIQRSLQPSPSQATAFCIRSTCIFGQSGMKLKIKVNVGPSQNQEGDAHPLHNT
jgi:hypothetical protein